MLICGIDPGQHGGIVFLTSDGKMFEKIVMPDTAKKLHSYLKDFIALHSDHKIHFYLEKAFAMTLQGVVSVFTYGKHFGEICGILDSLDIDYNLIAPNIWTKKLHVGYGHLATSKEKSLKFCSEIFPIKDFVATHRSKKPHDGLIDACLIAWYGKLLLEGNAK